MATNEELKLTVAMLEAQLAQHTREFNELKTSVALASGNVSDLRMSIDKLVTRFEFAPIKLLVYGLVGTVLTSVFAALLSKVLIK